MISVYFRELEKYTFEGLLKKFNIQDRKEGVFLIEKLKAYGIIKALNITSDDKELESLNTDEVEFLDENIDDKSKRYAFKFVGIVTVPKYVIICYPKYIKSNKKPELEMKQILKVIKKYNSDEQVIKFYNEVANEKSFNYLAMMLYLINDYYDNGIYSKEEQIIDVNSDGEILWDKTINETYAYILNNRPYYLELYTTNSVDDRGNYFTRLHQAIVTECSRKLSNLDLNKLLDIEEIELNESSIDEFGEKEYILYRLEKELNEQYITKKQSILKSLYTYISNSKTNVEGIGVCFYGTNNFNLVWEKVCSDVLDNKINTKLKKLPLNSLKEYENKTLKELIEKPIWKIYEDIIEREAKDTLIPDLISIFELEKEYGFAIFDAKYYDIGFNIKKIWGHPGVGDVTKQYLYQLAYKEFIDRSGYRFITNAFLIPTEESIYSNIGQAKMNILSNINGTKLKNIEIVKLNAKEMYEAFIDSKTIDIEKVVGILNEEENRQNYQEEIKNNIGAKIILNSIKKLVDFETLRNKEVEIEEYSYIQEKEETYLKDIMLIEIAIEIDRFFKQHEKVTSDKIQKLIEELIKKNSQIDISIINEKTLKKLQEIHEEYYLVMYWDK